MKHRLDNRTGTQESHRRLAAESLKRCPLCGAVNARSNGECFVCRWAGHFDHNPAHVEEGLSELLTRCPELADAILKPPTRMEILRHKVSRFFGFLFDRFTGRRRLDVFA